MVVVGSRPLTVAEVVAVARDHAPVEVDPAVDRTMAASRAVVESAVSGGRVVYGVTTGFGALARTHIPPDQAVLVQQARRTRW